MEVASKLSEDLLALVNRKEFSDVIFLVGKEKEPLFAIRGILSARSDVFQKMFAGGFKEGQEHSDNERFTVAVPNIGEC